MIKSKRSHVWTIIFTVTVFALGSVISMPTAQAETPFDIELSGSGWVIGMTDVNDFNIFFENSGGTGTVKSLHADKVFDGCNYQILTLRAGLKGRGEPNEPDGEALGFTKIIDKDGAFAIFLDRIKDGKMFGELVHGTGKWAGITGGYEGAIVSRGPPAETWQWTTRYTGRFDINPANQRPQRQGPGGPPPGGKKGPGGKGGPPPGGKK